jgi:hypothetical protein
MKLVVSGCSLTHGAELYNNFMHPENVKKSYSAHLAKTLDVDLINVALSAASNEYIFHSLINEIEQNSDIHSIIVMWTTTGRLYWNCNKRHYFIHAGHATSMINLVDFEVYDKTINNCWIVGDTDQIVDELALHQKFFVTNYFDNREDLKKLKNYKLTLDAVCKYKNIKLIQLSWQDIRLIGTWDKEKRHPNAEEHKQIATIIYEKYYENKHK